MSNSMLYDAGCSYEQHIKASFAVAFMEGALWLLQMIEENRLKLLPGGDVMFGSGYESGQESVLRKARLMCGKEEYKKDLL